MSLCNVFAISTVLKPSRVGGLLKPYPGKQGTTRE